MNRNYYAIIPANIRYDQDLPPNAKLLYGEITALSNEKGYCWASNSYFSDLYGVTKKTISNWIGSLVNKNYLYSQTIYKENSKEIKERRLYLTPPIEKNVHTYGKEVLPPMEEKFHTPIEKKVIDNNTLFNNTFNNHDDDNTRARKNEISEQNVYQFYQQNFGVLTPIIGEKLADWIKDLGEDLVKEALTRTLMNNTRSFNYAEAIMREWHHNNIKTLNQVKAFDLEFQSKRFKNQQQRGSVNEGFIAVDNNGVKRDKSGLEVW